VCGSSETALELDLGTNYTVTVGNGGAKASTHGTASKGNDSVLLQYF